MKQTIHFKCPWCEQISNAAGMSMHVKTAHQEHLVEYRDLRKKLKDEKNQAISETQPKIEFHPEPEKTDNTIPEISIPAQTPVPATDDEIFKVIPVIKPIAPEPSETQVGQLQIVSPLQMSEEEITNLLNAVLILPTMIYTKLPARSPEQIKPLAHELTLYAAKKGLDIRSYLFDELGLVLTGLTLGAGMYSDFKKAYPYEPKKANKEDEKLSSDFEHEKALAELQEKRLAEGLIK